MSTETGIEIRKLTPELLGDYIDFFESDAFEGNPDWEGCYCMEAHFLGTDEEWDAQPLVERRAFAADLVERGGQHGFLAFEGDRPVGWCNAAPLASYESDLYTKGRQIPDIERVGAVVCFNIAASHRRQGLTGRLLRAALDSFGARGLSLAEGYPWKEDSPKGPARNYHGPLAFWLAHGFQPHDELEYSVVVRKPLKEGGSP
jgi:GNAT superfamily N-acetyltransferase